MKGDYSLLSAYPSLQGFHLLGKKHSTNVPRHFLEIENEQYAHCLLDFSSVEKLLLDPLSREPLVLDE
ncbi:hypothetical protein [Sporosarcina sp. SAFN-010]|uniref:hypothetical protein n=1 Tax=Sporosarcina sp. SAFN-010 TaxID=3387273 RepID=UPI003F80DA73